MQCMQIHLTSYCVAMRYNVVAFVWVRDYLVLHNATVFKICLPQGQWSQLQ